MLKKAAFILGLALAASPALAQFGLTPDSRPGGALHPSAPFQIDARTTTTETLVASDLGKMVTFNNGSTVTLTVPQANGPFGPKFWTVLCDIGSGQVTVNPITSTIAKQAHIYLTAMGGCAELISDGTNYQAIPVQGFYYSNGAGSLPGLSLQIPDGTTAGGNVRGNYAVDLQLTRTVNTHVASGVGSFVAGEDNTASNGFATALGQANTASGGGDTAVGESNTASGGNDFAAGSGNNASGGLAVAMGHNNTASAGEAVAMGNNNTASQADAFALGQNSAADGANCFAVGAFAGCNTNIGLFAVNPAQVHNTTMEAQWWTCILAVRTSGASAVRMTSDATGSASTNNVCNIPNNYSFAWTAECVLSDSTTPKINTYSVGESLIYRLSNAASTAMASGNPAVTTGPVGASSMTLQAAPTVTADTTNGGFNISYTPPSGNTDFINAVCRISGTGNYN